MLHIAHDILPQTLLSYVAFRVSFFETLERIALAQQFDMVHQKAFGYLTEVPFLNQVAPQVQLDALLKTWHKHLAPEGFEASLVDESVVYAVCETAARVAEQEPVVMQRYLRRGPLPVSIIVDHQLAAELRSLHLKLSNEGDFLLISQFQDLPPEEAIRLKLKFRFDASRAESMFDVLGQFYMTADIKTCAENLLLAEETSYATKVLKNYQLSRKENVL
jgi:hypothetical protein